MMGCVGTCGMGCVCISESDCVHGCVSQGEMMSTLSPVRSTDAQGAALPHHPLGGERRVMCCVGACVMGCVCIWGGECVSQRGLLGALRSVGCVLDAQGQHLPPHPLGGERGRMGDALMWDRMCMCKCWRAPVRLCVHWSQTGLPRTVDPVG